MSDPPGTNPIGTHPIRSDPTGTGPTQSGTTGSYPKYAQTRPGHAEPAIEVLEHAWPVRLTHWLMAASILLMIGSGWRIYNASPIFPFRFPDAFTLGGDVNVALTWHNDPGVASAIQWHFAAMWLLALSYLLFVAWGALSLVLLMIVSGIAIWKPVQTYPLEVLFGGFQGARIVHFLGMAGICGFIVVHLALVALVPKTLVAMVVGRVTGHAPLAGHATADAMEHPP